MSEKEIGYGFILVHVEEVVFQNDESLLPFLYSLAFDIAPRFPRAYPSIVSKDCSSSASGIVYAMDWNKSSKSMIAFCLKWHPFSGFIQIMITVESSTNNATNGTLLPHGDLSTNV